MLIFVVILLHSCVQLCCQPTGVPAHHACTQYNCIHPSKAWLPACLQGELFVARAPGRLDVMGGIADYSGSLVLQVGVDHGWCSCTLASLLFQAVLPSGTQRLCRLLAPAVS